MKNSARWSLIFLVSCSGSILYTKPKRISDLPPPPPPLQNGNPNPGAPNAPMGLPNTNDPSGNPGPNNRPPLHDSSASSGDSRGRSGFGKSQSIPEGRFVAEDTVSFNLEELFFANRKSSPPTQSKDALDSLVDGVNGDSNIYKIRMSGIHSRENKNEHSVDITLDIINGKERLHLATNQAAKVLMSSNDRDSRQSLNAVLRGVNSANETVIIQLDGELKSKGWVIDVKVENEKIGTIYIERI